MKVEKKHTIGLFDVDYQGKLSVQAAARFFQESAVMHSTAMGCGPEVLFDKGAVWLLHRLEIEFFRYPVLHEHIRILTWSRRIKGYKSFREYHIQSSLGEVARGSSVWLYFDMNRKRISKIPVEILSLYRNENEKWFDKEVNDWKSCGKIEPENKMDIRLRYSDFDVNGHVNNTIYLGFLETLYHETMNTEKRPIRNIKIRFFREISLAKKWISSGWNQASGAYHCNIYDDSTLYADAEIIPMKRIDR